MFQMECTASWVYTGEGGIKEARFSFFIFDGLGYSLILTKLNHSFIQLILTKLLMLSIVVGMRDTVVHKEPWFLFLESL